MNLVGGTAGALAKITGSSLAVYNASFSGSGDDPDASLKVNIDGHDLYLYAYATPVS
jgi:hypothetical protein